MLLIAPEVCASCALQLEGSGPFAKGPDLPGPAVDVDMDREDDVEAQTTNLKGNGDVNTGGYGNMIDGDLEGLEAPAKNLANDQGKPSSPEPPVDNSDIVTNLPLPLNMDSDTVVSPQAINMDLLDLPEDFGLVMPLPGLSDREPSVGLPPDGDSASLNKPSKEPSQPARKPKHPHARTQPIASNNGLAMTRAKRTRSGLASKEILMLAERGQLPKEMMVKRKCGSK